MAYDIEGRISQLVCLVLAASVSGCGSATAPSKTGGESAGAPSGSSVTTTTVPTGTATATTTAATATTNAVVATAPDPTALCNAYKTQAAADPNGPAKRTPTETTNQQMRLRVDVSGFAVADGTVQCKIVWERNTSSRAVMIQPTCCPQAHMQTPCPPATLQLVPTQHDKMETVTLSADGKVISSSLVWSDWTDEPLRHNCGRRPEGFASALPAGDDDGGCLAEMAELESASIGAFDRLARELAAIGAPDALVARARAARRDEIRHAKAVRALARARGVTPRSVRARRLPVRAPLDVALENAVEGCVFESFGAAVATFQADRAADADVRAAFSRIAADERAHAALAWDVDAFLSTVLDERGRDAVERARAEARRRLRSSNAIASDSTRVALGLPSPHEHRALAASIASLA